MDRGESSWWFIMVLTFCFAVSCSTTVSAAALLKAGAKGSEVWELQLSLVQLGLLQVAPTGFFGTDTSEAVRRFQANEGLVVDGTVGNRTWQRLLQRIEAEPAKVHVVRSGDTLWSLARTFGISVEVLAKANRLRDADRLRVGQRLTIPLPGSASSDQVRAAAAAAAVDGTPAPSAGLAGPVTNAPTAVPTPDPDAVAKAREARARLTPQLLTWNEVQRLFPHNAVARIVDVQTGQSFRVRRYYGHLHADVEPLTAEDTAVLKGIYGKWGWNRRSVVVEIGGKRIAASINGYPHGNGAIKTNNFGGHFCVHFLGSRIHRTGRTDPDHQAAIRAAADAFSGAVVTTD